MSTKSLGIDVSKEETTETFSAAMRKLNKKEPEKVLEFMKAFKEAFDEALEEGVDDHQSVALLQAQKTVASKSENGFLKLAQMMTAGRNPQEVGSSLAQVIKILMEKLPHDKSASLANMRGKVSKLNPTEIALAAMPETAAYGQSITLIKTLLNGYSPEYIKQVLSTTTQSLY